MESTEKAAERINTVHVDGPYGGLTVNIPKRYDQLVLVAGGGGVSACLPLMIDAASRMVKGGACIQKINLIWMVRQASQLSWITEELEDALRIASSNRISFQFFVTEQKSPNSSQIDAGFSKDIEVVTSSPLALPNGASQVHYERPFLLNLVPKLLSGRRIMLFGEDFVMIYRVSLTASRLWT
jgi:hypothetical protein